jgi:hypothetical protein
MASFTRRFFAVRAAAQSLVSEIAKLFNIVCVFRSLQQRQQMSVRAAVVAVHHLDYALERARAAAVLPPPSLADLVGASDSEWTRMLTSAFWKLLSMTSQQYQVESCRSLQFLCLIRLSWLPAMHEMQLSRHSCSYTAQGLVLKVYAAI